MGKCFKKGCEAQTEEGSNYCASHLPGTVTAKKVLKGGAEPERAKPGVGGSRPASPAPRPPQKD